MSEKIEKKLFENVPKVKQKKSISLILCQA